jgi:hypothetical protein
MKLEKQLVIVNEFKQVTPRAMTRKILSEPPRDPAKCMERTEELWRR